MSKVTLAALRLPAGRFNPILSSFSLRDLPPFLDFALLRTKKGVEKRGWGGGHPLPPWLPPRDRPDASPPPRGDWRVLEGDDTFVEGWRSRRRWASGYRDGASGGSTPGLSLGSGSAPGPAGSSRHVVIQAPEVPRSPAAPRGAMGEMGLSGWQPPTLTPRPAWPMRTAWPDRDGPQRCELASLIPGLIRCPGAA